MTIAFAKPILIFGATMLAVSLNSVSAAAQNTNTTLQDGRVCINRTFQSGDSNDNATYQSCEININRTIQMGAGNRNNVGPFGRTNRNRTTQGWQIKHAGVERGDSSHGTPKDHKSRRRAVRRKGKRNDS